MLKSIGLGSHGTPKGVIKPNSSPKHQLKNGEPAGFRMASGNLSWKQNDPLGRAKCSNAPCSMRDAAGAASQWDSGWLSPLWRRKQLLTKPKVHCPMINPQIPAQQTNCRGGR